MAWYRITRNTGYPEIVSYENGEVIRDAAGRTMIVVGAESAFYLPDNAVMFETLHEVTEAWRQEVNRGLWYHRTALEKHEALLENGPTIRRAGER